MNSVEPTDGQLANQVSQAIESSNYRDLPEIKVTVHQSHVALDGTVSSYFLKQMAQALAARIPGVLSVTNRITVGGEAKSHVHSQEKQVATVADDGRP